VALTASWRDGSLGPRPTSIFTRNRIFPRNRIASRAVTGLESAMRAVVGVIGTLVTLGVAALGLFTAQRLSSPPVSPPVASEPDARGNIATCEKSDAIGISRVVEIDTTGGQIRLTASERIRLPPRQRSRFDIRRWTSAGQHRSRTQGAPTRMSQGDVF
jgi:hypothetical protein